MPSRGIAPSDGWYDRDCRRPVWGAAPRRVHHPSDLLREKVFSLQGNAKTLEGKQHPGRDAQFHYLNEQARKHQDGGAPIISVDTKKKELIGPN